MIPIEELKPEKTKRMETANALLLMIPIEELKPRRIGVPEVDHEPFDDTY